MSKWYYTLGGDDDVAVSTRVRLARNLKDFPFAGRLTDEGRRKVLGLAVEAAQKCVKDVRIVRMSDAKNAAVLVEKRLISPELAENRFGATALSEDESCSIMINEEDHLRIQSLISGYNLKEAYAKADAVETALSGELEFAYDQHLGYLTHCITNVGTGLRASVMLHLPAICSGGMIDSVVAEAGKLGVAVRGSFGEGSAASGCLFQFSNQITLGLTEQQIVEKLSAIIDQIIATERRLREQMRERNKAAFDDKIWRAFGTLAYCRNITAAEFDELISPVRLGVSMGIIKGVALETVNSLMASAGPGCVAEQFAAATPQARDEARSGLVRSALAGAREQ